MKLGPTGARFNAMPCLVRGLGRLIPASVRRALHAVWLRRRGCADNINTPEYWDAVYAREGQPTEGDSRDYDALHRAILNLMPRSARVLDVGCGTGRLACKLVAKGCVVVGIDFSKRAVEVCQALGLDARQCTLPSIDASVGTFDAAVCTEVLEHLRDPKQTVAAVQARVREGGLVAFSVPAAAAIDREKEHVQLFGRGDLLRLMRAHLDDCRCVLVKGRQRGSMLDSWLVWGVARRDP